MGKDARIDADIVALMRGSAGAFVSGEAMSRTLGVSRACVWKYMEKIREDGFDIEAVPHKGYRIISEPDKLYGYLLSAGLGTRMLGKGRICYYEETESTNDRAYALAEGGGAEGLLVVAESQSRGKGRMERKWVSPAGGGIYLSIILRPRIEISRVPAITLVIALSVMRAIEKTCGLVCSMKWPNDVLVNGKKVCGILTEMKAQPDMVEFLIAGIGVNVNTPPSKLPPGAGSLSSEGAGRVDRAELTRNLLEALEADYDVFRVEGFSEAVVEKCRAISAVLGKRIKVVEANSSFEGTAEEIDADGALIVRAAGGRRRKVFSGDVSIR